MNETLCNSNQKRNHDECQCECKELDDWSDCKIDYLWNFSTCSCEGNKAYKIDENLNNKNCPCQKCLH